MKLILTILVAGMVMVHLTACSKTVEWEEEVPLNTGEIIWVKRSGRYNFESESGNPLKFGYRPDWRSTIEFSYKGKHYTHTDVVTLLLLAIGPDGAPTLVADPRRDDWQWKHKYYCVTPYYVQFIADKTGKGWTWPAKIEPWLFGLPTNLIFGLPPLESSGRKYSPTDRANKNASIAEAFGEFKRIESKYTVDNCPRR